MYESPIEIVRNQLQVEIDQDIQNNIYQAVLGMGIKIDKDLLMKALYDSRCYYDLGYQDGSIAALQSYQLIKDDHLMYKQDFKITCSD